MPVRCGHSYAQEDTLLERTLVLIKPDGVQRSLIGEIIGRFEKKGFKLVAMKLMMVTPEIARQHYAEHVEKSFYPGLEKFITSSPVVAMVWEGGNAIQMIRDMMGKTNPLNAAPGTIRADFGVETGQNLVHGSDSPESAAREISIFFRENELVNWQRGIDLWVYEPK
jgi:nucleoside-diphosphate kinase